MTATGSGVRRHPTRVRGLGRLRRDDAGLTAIELVASVPLLVLVTLVLVQGYQIVSGIEATTKAARDAARAEADGRDGDAAALRQLPDWVDVASLDAGGGACEGVCRTVVVDIPYGVPGILTAGSFRVERSADFPRT